MPPRSRLRQQALDEVAPHLVLQALWPGTPYRQSSEPETPKTRRTRSSEPQTPTPPKSESLSGLQTLSPPCMRRETSASPGGWQSTPVAWAEMFAVWVFEASRGGLYLKPQLQTERNKPYKNLLGHRFSKSNLTTGDCGAVGR